MIKGGIVTLFRKDLFENKKDKSIEELSLSDFKILPDHIIYEEHLIQFIDSDKTKIFKNRFGKTGIVCKNNWLTRFLINLNIV